MGPRVGIRVGRRQWLERIRAGDVDWRLKKPGVEIVERGHPGLWVPGDEMKNEPFVSLFSANFKFNSRGDVSMEREPPPLEGEHALGDIACKPDRF
jgi:hypothetical protein